ncbi:hypothetical protein B0J13DRAFT_522637 [Dactylonectria estremocensis]|uniref:Uncharacterized protein n=1 Tax=Dactylonectria estremocensis TaxID=1079267 RepID=A0A9P9JB86_9HYPO|nr:hypothetical protein B0J13DRAFT_522637 [Dactylonectria estremocensis]
MKPQAAAAALLLFSHDGNWAQLLIPAMSSPRHSWTKDVSPITIPPAAARTTRGVGSGPVGREAASRGGKEKERKAARPKQRQTATWGGRHTRDKGSRRAG